MAEINSFSNPTYFNSDVTFYKDVTIGGEFKYDNLSVKTLSVVGGGSTQYLMADGSTTTKHLEVFFNKHLLLHSNLDT